MSDISEKAIHIAAQCWCDEETQTIEMDTRLATAFAKRLDNDYAAIAELTESNVKLRAENAEIAQALGLSLRAIKGRMIGIAIKYGVTKRTEIITKHLGVK